jgi:hypothetical protein
MAVKLLMSWDILPGREQEYFEFVVGEFVPGLQRLGIKPSEAWYTTYGERPQILTGGIAESMASMRRALESDEWNQLREKLLQYVGNFRSRVVKAREGFQML